MNASVLAPSSSGRSPAAAAQDAFDLDGARAQVEALARLLEDEFEALRTQSFDQLESLQPAKLALLESLSALSAEINAAPELPEQWPALLETLRQCRDTWRRNEQLVIRQLEVVRGALRSMQAADPSASVELYDRMGQASRRLASRVFSEA